MRASKTVRQRAKNKSYAARQQARDKAYEEKKMRRAKKKSIDAQQQHEQAMAHIRETGRTASATAISGGAATLGIGLNAENNQDAQADRDNLTQRIQDILNYGSSSNIESDTTGLKTAVM